LCLANIPNKKLTSAPTTQKGVEGMERRLVLSSEGAGHYMRRLLSPEALKVNNPIAERPRKWWQKDDTHLFGISFGAFFTVFYTFIA
jgi:hypothetical protein